MLVVTRGGQVRAWHAAGWIPQKSAGLEEHVVLSPGGKPAAMNGYWGLFRSVYGLHEAPLMKRVGETVSKPRAGYLKLVCTLSRPQTRPKSRVEAPQPAAMRSATAQCVRNREARGGPLNAPVAVTDFG